MSPDETNTELDDQDMELLSQYIDGELGAPESRALEARLHEDSSLQSVMLRMQELNHRLSDMLNEDASIPEHISEALKPAPKSPLEETGAIVLNFPGGKIPSRTASTPRWAYALAATLLAAFAVVLVNDNTSSRNTPWDNNALVSTALDKAPSGSDWSSLADGSEIQPVLTFPHDDGRWCREYLLRSSEADWRAVSCREEGRWVTQAAGLESYLETSDAYRAAGASDSAPVAVFISQHAADIALGREQETVLIQQRWR